ncbi:hypothetical protein [uncultured Hymenobacter sp.]|uniref:hypothetical protein n=1 Tax=uncultured Hymenobacter sp. TaxID=170016 RepID=UPI0035C9679A
MAVSSSSASDLSPTGAASSPDAPGGASRSAPGSLHLVTTPAHAREFLAFAVRLYQGDANYVRPLDQDVAAVFDPARNKFFQHGALARWLLVDGQGQTLGRIAAFVNERTARTFAQPTGGVGFFECLDSEAAATQLFDAARLWLQGRGMAAMDGPINFGDRDQWWGLLIDNFGPPLYGQTYNPPYYQRLFESYGFQLYFHQYTYFRAMREPFKPALAAIAGRLLTNPSYRVEHLQLAELPRYTEDFRLVYNQAWARHDGVEEMSPEQAQALLRKLRAVLDARLIWFAYHEGQPIGFFVALPELNELFKYVDGRLDWLGKLRFAWYRWRGVGRTATGIAFGVVPAFQRRGVEAALIVASARLIQRAGRQLTYEQFVLNWIGDFNPKMMAVASQIGCHIWRTHATYRYLFDRERPFERAPVI